MHKLKLVLVGTSLVFAVTSVQAAEVSGNVTLATDYVWRGVSQTDEEPTIQGGFDVSLGRFYVGAWGSNVAFAGSMEGDLYAGFTYEIGDDISYDLGLLRYHYPNQPGSVEGPIDPGTGEPTLVPTPDLNFSEIYFNFAYRDLGFGIAYSDDYSGELGTAVYYSLDYGISLPAELNLGLHYGKQNIDLGEDYSEYAISVTREMAGVELGLSWHDTDITSCNACESRVVFSLSKSM